MGGLVDPNLTRSDLLLLHNLLDDVEKECLPSAGKSSVMESTTATKTAVNGSSQTANGASLGPSKGSSQTTIKTLEGLNDAKSPDFEPTVFVTWDTSALLTSKRPVLQYFLQKYIKLGQSIVRHPTDVVMLTHLILYFTTSIPSAIYLYRNFSYLHGILHVVMQFYYTGTYTLMRHQHIHAGGILAKSFPMNVFDAVFPYITDPLMGHTWNSYYYHHVKHHHVEGNGPNDLSSTLRFQRDEPMELAKYVLRFFFLIWTELPLYFVRTRKYGQAFKCFFWEFSDFVAIALLARWRMAPTIFVFMLPLFLIRLGLMIGNWGQHCFVDEVDPTSDFRSSITLIDVASNRFCFNDGYHTSHHLNPRRHWREHPIAFLKQKDTYAEEHALVFRNIDFLEITYRVVTKNYAHLAKCLVPMGDQITMSMEERMDMLRSKTRKFSEEEIARIFGGGAGRWSRK